MGTLPWQIHYFRITSPPNSANTCSHDDSCQRIIGTCSRELKSSKTNYSAVQGVFKLPPQTSIVPFTYPSRKSTQKWWFSGFSTWVQQKVLTHKVSCFPFLMDFPQTKKILDFKVDLKTICTLSIFASLPSNCQRLWRDAFFVLALWRDALPTDCQHQCQSIWNLHFKMVIMMMITTTMMIMMIVKEFEIYISSQSSA